MKNLFPIILSFVLFGCAHHVSIVDAQNGIERSRTEGTLGVFSSELVTSGNNQMMPNCEAGIGAMDDGEERAICTRQVRADKRRRAYQLDFQTYPYYYPPSVYATQP